MLPTTTIEPARLTMADLDGLAARQSTLAVRPVEPAPVRAKITRRDAEHEILGAVKLIARINGMDTTKLVHPVELLVQRIDQLEDVQQQLQRDNAELRKALASISTSMEAHENPFDDKPPSKYSKAELGQLIIGIMETKTWVMQRAENALDPRHAIPIAADPE